MDTLVEQVRWRLETGMNWIAHLGWEGGILFIAVYALATVLLLPASWLTLGAGAIYGLGRGTIYVLIGAMIGAQLAFLIGRYLARQRVQRLLAGIPSLQAILRGIERGGWKVVGLIRLSPALPFNLVNYALGLTSISLLDNLIGTLGILPGTLMYVYLGAVAGDVALGFSEPQVVPWVVRLLGLVATVAATVYVTALARQVLQQNLTEE